MFSCNKGGRLRHFGKEAITRCVQARAADVGHGVLDLARRGGRPASSRQPCVQLSLAAASFGGLSHSSDSAWPKGRRRLRPPPPLSWLCQKIAETSPESVTETTSSSCPSKAIKHLPVPAFQSLAMHSEDAVIAAEPSAERAAEKKTE